MVLGVRDYEAKVRILLKSLSAELNKNLQSSNLLELFISLSEARNKATGIVKSSLKLVNFCYLNLSSSDVHFIGSVLALAKEIGSVQITHCNLDSYKLEVLWKLVKDSEAEVSDDLLSSSFGLCFENCNLSQ